MQRQSQQTAPREPGDTRRRTAHLRDIEIPEMITVAHLAGIINNASPIELMKQLMRAGVMASMNEVIDFDTAAAIIPAFGYQAVKEEAVTNDSPSEAAGEADTTVLESRPPVVTVLGHVDHGKTSLLDAIRKTKVAEHEAGGITQHIGAYQIEYNNQKITFLDTPGHEAFTAMRARGANITDVAVLVVAADDGIMPQTIEAINHVKAANVPLVVAINKVDKPDADPDRVKRQLAEQGLLIEDWGGDVIAVEVSAKAETGIDELLENILVVSEIAELKANPNRPAHGVVVEAKLDKSRGCIATVLVKNGTLKLGDHLVIGTVRGRVKALTSAAGKRVTEAGPSTPVEIMGLSELPLAGDTFMTVASEREARAIVEARLRKQEGVRRHNSLEDMVTRIRTGQSKELNLIIKTDVQGSTEAVRDAVSRLSAEKARVRIVHAASGSITETDVFLAVASEAMIIGFNTAMEQGARRLAESEHLEIRFYSVIYTLVEDVQRILEGMLEPVTQDVVEGLAEVRAVFARGRRSKVAGCLVTEGRAVRNAMARVRRKNEVVHDGPIASLRRVRDDVREVSAGTECGITLANFDDFQEGDILEIHRQEVANR